MRQFTSVITFCHLSHYHSYLLALTIIAHLYNYSSPPALSPHHSQPSLLISFSNKQSFLFHNHLRFIIPALYSLSSQHHNHFPYTVTHQQQHFLALLIPHNQLHSSASPSSSHFSSQSPTFHHHTLPSFSSYIIQEGLMFDAAA